MLLLHLFQYIQQFIQILDLRRTQLFVIIPGQTYRCKRNILGICLRRCIAHLCRDTINFGAVTNHAIPGINLGLEYSQILIAVNRICNVLDQPCVNTFDKIRIIQQNDIAKMPVAAPCLIQTGRITGYLWSQYAQFQAEFLCHQLGEPSALNTVIVCRHIIYFNFNHVVGRISAFRSTASRRIFSRALRAGILRGALRTLLCAALLTALCSRLFVSASDNSQSHHGCKT